LKLGADPNANENMCLLICCQKGYLKIVRLLIDNKAKVDDKCLLSAAKNQHLEIIYILLKNGGNLSVLIDWVT